MPLRRYTAKRTRRSWKNRSKENEGYNKKEGNCGCLLHLHGPELASYGISEKVDIGRTHDDVSSAAGEYRGVECSRMLDRRPRVLCVVMKQVW